MNLPSILGWKGLALLGALLGLSGVIMAALGSHAIPGAQEPANYRSWQAASLLHLVHAVALLALAALGRASPSILLGPAGVLMALGVVLFSGSIYAVVVFDLAGTGMAAPAGGVLLITGWALLILLVTRS